MSIRDGIAFGLFATSDQALMGFFQEAHQKVELKPEEENLVAEQLLKSYEAYYGAIKELFT